MPTPTYTPIASTTLSSSQASVTFSNLNTLAAGMRDLIIVCSVTTSQNSDCRLNFNGVTGSSYSSVEMFGDGSTPSSASFSGQSYIKSYYVDTPTSGSSNFIFQVFDFAQTDKHKSALLRANVAEDATSAVAGRFASTNAITSATISSSVNFNTGSTFSLYGVIA